MKKRLFILLLAGCSKKDAGPTQDKLNNAIAGIRFLANNVEWRTGVNPGEPISESNHSNFQYYSQMAAANSISVATEALTVFPRNLKSSPSSFHPLPDLEPIPFPAPIIKPSFLPPLFQKISRSCLIIPTSRLII
jgi:hypothetical protein